MNLADRRFVVFGGAGFIGAHLTHLLARQPVAEVVVFDSLVRDEVLEPALKTGKVRIIQGDVVRSADVSKAVGDADGIFHLAALPINSCVKMPRDCVEVNVLGTFNILEAAQKQGAKKIVFSSASSVYGDTSDWMDESHPLKARTLYGACKVASEYFLRAFHSMYGLDYVALRYMNVYGPDQVGGVIMAAMKRIQQGLPPVIFGDGEQSFDFVYVEDVVQANLLAMQSDVTDEVFNVGSGTEASVKDIVSLLLELTGADLQPVFEPERDVAMLRRVGKYEKAARMLGYHPQVSLREGVARVIQSMGMRVAA